MGIYTEEDGVRPSKIQNFSKSSLQKVNSSLYMDLEIGNLHAGFRRSFHVSSEISSDCILEVILITSILYY